MDNKTEMMLDQRVLWTSSQQELLVINNNRKKALKSNQPEDI